MDINLLFECLFYCKDRKGALYIHACCIRVNLKLKKIMYCVIQPLFSDKAGTTLTDLGGRDTGVGVYVAYVLELPKPQ